MDNEILDFIVDDKSNKDTVQWELDVINSSDEDADAVPAHIVRKIPKYNEQDIPDANNLEMLPPRTRDSKVIDLLKNSIIKPGFEQLNAVPAPSTSRRALKRERKKQRDMTKGPGWYNLPAQEITEEVKNDLELLKMRSVLDPKHFYKNNDINHTPKYFQVGTVLETPADFYNGRIPKAQRKRTLVNELMADAKNSAYQKKKYKSIVDNSRYKKGPSKKRHSK